MSDFEPTRDELDNLDFGRTRDRLIWSEMRKVRRRYAGEEEHLTTIHCQILGELWAMVRISWQDEEYWQRRHAESRKNSLYIAALGGDPPPPPEPIATSLREYSSIMCRCIEKFLLNKVSEYEAKEAAENDDQDRQ